MKTLLKFLPALVCISMLVSCEDRYPNQCADSQKTSLPVDAYFNTSFSKNVLPEGTIDLKGSVLQLVQTGTGTDAELGFFQIRLTCCLSVADCIIGRSGGSLTDSDGNILNIRCKENLTTSDFRNDFPSNQTHITGKFEFTGGTGKFEGATGEGTIDCFVDSSTMSHHWTGSVKYAIPD